MKARAKLLGVIVAACLTGACAHETVHRTHSARRTADDRMPPAVERAPAPPQNPPVAEPNHGDTPNNAPASGPEHL